MIELLILLSILFLFAIRGRKNPRMAPLRDFVYAHRGLHDAQKPENSLAAFRAAVEHGYGMELDVHLTKDGTLAVIHDSLLARTTGKPGKIEDLTADDLNSCFLEGTTETIPTLPEVLALVDGKVPLIIEVKTDGGNYAALTEAVCELLRSYGGLYCLESFDPRAIHWLKKNRPDLLRGQLAENYFRTASTLPWYLKLCLSFQLFNFLTQPDFTAYSFPHRKNLPTLLVRKLWGVQGVSWTLRTKEDFDTAVAEGWVPIFENFIP